MRLTVRQLTQESRGNGGGLRPRVWLRLRAAAGGNWTPDAYNWKASQFLLVLEHEAHPKTTLYGVVFQKIEWAPASRARFKDRNCRNWEATLPVRSHGHVPSGAGGCGYRPRPRGGVAMTDIATHNDPIATIGMDLGKRNLIGMDARGTVAWAIGAVQAKYRGRGPITKNQVAALLRDYDIRPVVVLEPISRGTVTGQRNSTTRLRVSCLTSRTSEHSSARGCDVRMFGCSDVYHWMGRTAKAVCLPDCGRTCP